LALRIIAILCVSLPSARLLAFNDSLSFRLNPSGVVEAIVSGLNDGCSVGFGAPSSVTVTGLHIAITSPPASNACFLPLPAIPYQVIASLGPLSPATYEVTWAQDSLVLAAQLSPSALPPPSDLNYTAMWWNPAESGWGLNINQQDLTLFATLFSYDSDGAPMWLVAPNLALQVADGSYRGTLYRASGPPFNAAPWTAIHASIVGGMTIRFTTDHTGSVSYFGLGTSVTKNIEKEVFGTPTSCVEAKGSRSTLANYQDMWWNPNESGWGISLTHQGSTILAVLFTYDANGRDMWLVASNLARQTDGSFTGSLYSTRGPPFSASSWSAISAAPIGSMSLRFIDGESATLSYTVNGIAVTKSIQREVFGSALPRCQ
jgi:hypothetical protein